MVDAASGQQQMAGRERIGVPVVDGIGARLVVVGADFHFGHRRGGNVPLLERMGAELGFEVLGLGLVAVEGEASGVPYSSTRIRELLAKGDVAEAAMWLCSDHAAWVSGARINVDGGGERPLFLDLVKEK